MFPDIHGICLFMHKLNYNIAYHNRILQGCLYNKSSEFPLIGFSLAYTWYILVVSRALVICPDMYTHAIGSNGPWAWVYISGKSLMPMMQLVNVSYICSCICSAVLDNYHHRLAKHLLIWQGRSNH